MNSICSQFVAKFIAELNIKLEADQINQIEAIVQNIPEPKRKTVLDLASGMLCVNSLINPNTYLKPALEGIQRRVEKYVRAKEEEEVVAETLRLMTPGIDYPYQLEVLRVVAEMPKDQRTAITNAALKQLKPTTSNYSRVRLIEDISMAAIHKLG